MEGRSIMSCKDQKLRGSLTLRQLKIYQPESRWLATPMYWLIIAPDFLPPNLGAAIAIYFHNRCIPFQKEAKDWTGGIIWPLLVLLPTIPFSGVNSLAFSAPLGFLLLVSPEGTVKKFLETVPKKNGGQNQKTPMVFLRSQGKFPKSCFFCDFCSIFFVEIRRFHTF